MTRYAPWITSRSSERCDSSGTGRPLSGKRSPTCARPPTASAPNDVLLRADPARCTPPPRSHAPRPAETKLSSLGQTGKYTRLGILVRDALAGSELALGGLDVLQELDALEQRLVLVHVEQHGSTPAVLGKNDRALGAAHLRDHGSRVGAELG